MPADQDPKEVIRRYYIQGDIHWNEEGHRLVAGRLLEKWAASPSMIRSPSSD
jgi:hypothetical protein